VSIRRYSGPTPTSIPGEYRVWLSDQPSAEFRRRFLKHAQTKEARPLRLCLDKNAATFTFVTSGDLKADLQAIDLLLKEASVGVTVGEAVVVTGTRTWQQQHARMMRAYQRAASATAVTIQVEDDFYSFFVWCFHLKDWLKNDPPIPAAIKTAAGVLVNTNESLKLCADLANGIKHLRADRSARVDPDSKVSAVQSAFQATAFQKDAFQTHERIVVVAAGSYFDAREVANACIAAWAAFFREHKLT